jgi:hypothetical protein
MKKQITDELIEEILNKTKFNEQDSHDEDHIQKVVLDHYDSEITDDWNVSCDFFIYEETTADGYSVYVATYDQRSISVSEHVHYYDNNLGDELRQAICEGIKIYIDDVQQYYVQDVIRDLYVILSKKKEEEIIDQLIDEGYEESK